MQSELWKSDGDWFVDWFNRPAYHVLYGHRGEEEACSFLKLLAARVFPSKKASILDLACGAGRHVRCMERLGYDAHGLDLSSNSIQEARSKASNPTHFQIGDMRSFASDLGWESQFDVVTCLFTSFGYFEDEADQLRTLVQIRRALKPGGSLVLDFLNAPYVEHHLVTEECAVKGLSDGRQMEFLIHRRIFNGWIEKSIQFVDASGATQHHVERVRALHLNDLKAMFKQAGFDVTHVFGDYLLKAHSDLSNRCILVAS